MSSDEPRRGKVLPFKCDGRGCSVGEGRGQTRRDETKTAEHR